MTARRSWGLRWPRSQRRAACKHARLTTNKVRIGYQYADGTGVRDHCSADSARRRRRVDRIRPSSVANELDIDKILLRISGKDRSKSAPWASVETETRRRPVWSKYDDQYRSRARPAIRQGVGEARRTACTGRRMRRAHAA